MTWINELPVREIYCCLICARPYNNCSVSVCLIVCLCVLVRHLNGICVAYNMYMCLVSMNRNISNTFELADRVFLHILWCQAYRRNQDTFLDIRKQEIRWLNCRDKFSARRWALKQKNSTCFLHWYNPSMKTANSSQNSWLKIQEEAGRTMKKRKTFFQIENGNERKELKQPTRILLQIKFVHYVFVVLVSPVAWNLKDSWNLFSLCNSIEYGLWANDLWTLIHQYHHTLHKSKISNLARLWIIFPFGTVNFYHSIEYIVKCRELLIIVFFY